MTREQLIDLLTADSDEFNRFEHVQRRRSNRPDIHAFILLDEIAPKVPEEREHRGMIFHNMITAAEHDEIWLNVDLERLAENITPEQVTELIRCGVRYDSEMESLCMFV